MVGACEGEIMSKKILIACEFSGRVRNALAERGHNAWSCDLLPTEIAGNHYQGDVLDILNDGWDMMIAHPPCTYLSNAGARWMYPTAGNLSQERFGLAMEAKDFFMKLLNAPINYIAIENPVPLKVVGLPKHNQAIQPYEFGHEYSKKTLLWLKNLPLLQPTCRIEPYTPYLRSNTGGKKRGQRYSKGVAKNAKESSKTFEGIARAMAEQWG